jgi:hypothetical protein
MIMKKESLKIFLAVSIVMVCSFNLFSQDKTTTGKEIVMKRFLVERTFPNGLIIPVNEEGSKMCLSVVSNNAEDNVTWIHSYVTKDKKKTFCIYDAPSEAAIRKSAKANGLPVDNITEVSVLDPYFYK